MYYFFKDYILFATSDIFIFFVEDFVKKKN